MTALSFQEAKRPFPKGSSVISIGAPNTPSPPGVRTSEDSHLRVEFDDIASDPPSKDQRKYFHPPEKEHVEKIIDFARNQKGPLVTHCRAGVSRSTAADVIGKCARGKDPEEAYRSMLSESPDAARVRPNRRMLRLADDALGHDTNDLQKLLDRQDELKEEIARERD